MGKLTDAYSATCKKEYKMYPKKPKLFLKHEYVLSLSHSRQISVFFLCHIFDVTFRKRNKTLENKHWKQWCGDGAEEINTIYNKF